MTCCLAVAVVVSQAVATLTGTCSAILHRLRSLPRLLLRRLPPMPMDRRRHHLAVNIDLPT